MIYVVAFAATGLVSAALAFAVRRLAVRVNIIDRPEIDPSRKIHGQPTPLLGGLAPLTSFFLVLGCFLWWRPDLTAGFPTGQYFGLAIASLLLAVGGFLDDRFRLPPQWQILWPVLATISVIMSGVGVHFITNPFGGLIDLDVRTITVLTVAGVPLLFQLWADVFSFVWLMGMSYTTKFLDGLDGLVAGVSAIGGFIIFVVSLRPEVNQSTTALVAILFSGAMVGVLPLNFHPARLFLGEAGSLWAGFMLGTLAIISGGKIATALLLMGIPILDVVWVIVRRLREGRSPFRGADRKHLHFRLLEVGLSHRQAVLSLYVLTSLFGLMTLLFHGWQKVVALGVLFAVMVTMGTALVVRSRRYG